MFQKLMNSYYYGKSGKGDYEKEDLPQTRWQLFWEMLKIRLSALCRLNLMYFVAWLPAVLVILMAVMSAYSGLANLTDLQVQADAGEITAEVLGQNMLYFNEGIKALILRTLLWLVPCIFITGPCTAGAAYITRNWARDEHAFIWADFRDAVKENWKQALAISGITSVMPLVLYVCWTFYGEMAGQSVFFVVPQILSVTLVLVWLCSLMYAYPLMVTYRLRFRDLIRNAVLLTVGRLPMTLGLKALSLVPALIAVLVTYFTGYVQWAVLGVAAYYLVIGLALSRFVGASYANAVFDRFINPNIEGAPVGKGLYVPDEEDEDEEQAETEVKDMNLPH